MSETNGVFLGCTAKPKAVCGRQARNGYACISRDCLMATDNCSLSMQYKQGFLRFLFFNSFAQEHNKRVFSVFVPFVPLDVLQLKTFCHFNKYHVIDNQTIGICR